MQCAYTILSSVTCPALQYSSTLSLKQQDFLDKKLFNIKSVPETFLMLRGADRDAILSVIRLAVRCLLILSDFNLELAFC